VRKIIDEKPHSKLAALGVVLAILTTHNSARLLTSSKKLNRGEQRCYKSTPVAFESLRYRAEYTNKLFRSCTFTMPTLGRRRAGGLQFEGLHRGSTDSWLDAVGTPIAVQQELMRHADIRTTMNIYGDIVTDKMAVAGSKVAGLALNGSKRIVEQ